MGGFFARDKFVSSENGSPINIFELVRVDGVPNLDIDWIMGGSIPAYRSITDWLKMHNVGMIVSLTIEKIKLGRNINHIPNCFNETEWLDSDLEEKDLADFQIEHVPIADANCPTRQNAEKLLKIVSDYRHDHPDKKVYFHCWAGRGRTCTAVVYILMKLYGLSLSEAETLLAKQYEQFKLTEPQKMFLRGDIDESDMEYLNFIDPIIKTPKDHKCFESFL